MPQPPIDAQIDALMEQASRALATGGRFEAERLAQEALTLARAGHRFERMARITLPLQEARRLRTEEAFDVGVVRIVDFPIADQPPEPGCWLVQPPQVGADARRLRLAALAAGVPAVVLCREPLTRLGRTPVVAVGANVLRAYVDPPADQERPDLAWFVRSLETLGDTAIAVANEEREIIRRIDGLLSALEALPEHEKLHQALAAACRTADRAAASGALAAPSPTDDEEAPVEEDA